MGGDPGIGRDFVDEGTHSGSGTLNIVGRF